MESQTEEQDKSETIVRLASERARNAQRAWREAQQKRLLAAREAERLAIELKATEEQAAARIAAVRAVAVTRRAAELKRLDAATRAEKLETALAGSTRSPGKTASRYWGMFATSLLLVGALTILVPASTASSTEPVLVAKDGDSLSLRLSYGLEAPASR